MDSIDESIIGPLLFVRQAKLTEELNPFNIENNPWRLTQECSVHEGCMIQSAFRLLA